MFGLSPQQLVGAAGLVFGIGWAAYEWGLFKYLKWPTFAKAKPDHKAILSLLDDAHAYFDSVDCDEGKAAIRTAIGHVYAEHPHP